MEHIRDIIKRTSSSDILKESRKLQDINENPVTTECPVCKGAGFIYPSTNGKPDYSITIPCHCVKNIHLSRRKEYLLKYCELPKKSDDMRFDNFEVYPEIKSAFKTAKTIASHPDRWWWVTFMGSNDTGKTHLAIAICKAWINQGVAAKYAYVPFLLDELREGYKLQNDNSFEQRFRRLCDVPLLVLDDLGKGKPSEWAIEKLETLVDYRAMNKLSLIVTTNKTIEEIQESVSFALGSRLVRYPEANIIEINAIEHILRNKNE